MALYTEQSADILASMLRAGEEDRRRKQQEKALKEYNAQKAQTDSKYDGGLGGFLGNIVGGIGKSIGDVGYALGGLFGTAGASVKDLIEGKAGTAENTNAFKRTYYGAKDDKDAAAKAAGNALNAATTIATTVAPGVAGAGTAAGKVLGGTVANTAAGALGGVADELAQQGSDARLDSAANRAISGAVAGLATGGLNKKIGNATGNISSKLLNNKLATSTIGRGALSGAVGGATGAGTSAALGGGDIAQAALQGARTGAISGATQAGITSLGNKAIQKIGGTRVNQATTTTDTKTNAKTQNGLDVPDYTKPTDYQGNEIKIEKKNFIQKLGDNLSKTGERIENADLYNSLYSKTAAQVTKNGTVDKLRQLGYNPSDYKEAAKISTTTNKFVDDIVKNSGANIVDNGLVDRIAKPSTENTIATPAYQKVYDETVKQVFNTIENGDIPGRYNASDLLKASRKVNKIANKYAKKATSVNGGDLATDAGALADALMDVKYELRNLATKSVDGFGDNYTKTQLSERLRNLGATDAAIADMMEAKNIGEFISKTAKYEDARQMDYEMGSNEFRRNAVSGSKSNANPIQRLIQDSGAGEIVSVATRPVGKLAGKGARTTGNFISNLGESLGSSDSGSTTKVQTQPMSQDAQVLLGNIIGRTQGQAASSGMVQNARKAEDYQSLEGLLSEIQNNENNIQALQLAQQQAQVQEQLRPLQNQLADIQNGMSLALAAGDFTSYNQLANLYKNAYSLYETQVSAMQQGTTASTKSNAKLSKTQQQANAAALALDELENMNPDFGYSVKDIPLLNLINLTGNKYSSTADSLAMQIGYMLSGANIKEDEARKIGTAYVPQPFDDEATRRYKLQQARNIIQQYQNTYTTDDNNNNA